MHRHGSPSARVLATLLATSVVAVGCGGGDDEEAPPPAPPAPEVEMRKEKADSLPDFPRGFEKAGNTRAGIAFGRAPGWKAQRRGALTIVRAPDKLVALSITTDRTPEALATEPGNFATQTAEALQGYREPLSPSKAKGFPHRYDGSRVRAKGVSKDGVRQDVQVVVLRRKGVAVVTAVIASNAKEKKSGPEVAQALEMLETLRTRPPEESGGKKKRD